MNIFDVSFACLCVDKTAYETQERADRRERGGTAMGGVELLVAKVHPVVRVLALLRGMTVCGRKCPRVLWRGTSERVIWS